MTSLFVDYVLVSLFGPSKEVPKYLTTMVYWVVFFWLFELLSWSVLNWVVPKYMASLDPVCTRSYVTKSTSTLHAVITTGFSGYIISTVHNLRLDEMHITLPKFQALCALSGGYFVLDIWGMGRNGFIHYPADLVHHLVSVSIAFRGIVATEFEHIMYYGPWMLLIELSTVFMNISLLLCGLRHKPRPDKELTPAIKRWNLKLQIAFALSFFLLRAVMFPIIVGHMYWSWPEQFSTYMGGGLRLFSYMLVLLQWMWMYKIARAAVKTMKKLDSIEGESKNIK